jgi:hypothetical protein
MESIKFDLNKFKVGKSEKIRRDLIIKDIAGKIGKTVKEVWKWTQFPVRIPTEWLEGWYSELATGFNTWECRKKFFYLLENSKK